MGTQKLPLYTPAEIERRALVFLRNRLGKAYQTPIDIDLLLEQTPGVRLDAFVALKSEHLIEGCVCRIDGSSHLTVFVDRHVADNDELGYRMVVAEELGHVTLQRRLVLSTCSIEEAAAIYRSPDATFLERDARAFGRAVLMPAPRLVAIVEALYPRIVDTVGFDEPQVIEKNLRTALANHFRVRPEEVLRRLAQNPIGISRRLLSSIRARSAVLQPRTNGRFDAAQLRLWNV